MAHIMWTCCRQVGCCRIGQEQLNLLCGGKLGGEGGRENKAVPDERWIHTPAPCRAVQAKQRTEPRQSTSLRLWSTEDQATRRLTGV